MQNWTVGEWSAFLVALTAAVAAIGGTVVNVVLAIKQGRKLEEVKKTTEEVRTTTAEQSKVLDYQTEKMGGPAAVAKSKE